jgi:hypothetical protein
MLSACEKVGARLSKMRLVEPLYFRPVDSNVGFSSTRSKLRYDASRATIPTRSDAEFFRAGVEEVDGHLRPLRRRHRSEW